jgi:hypothetical protein
MNCVEGTYSEYENIIQPLVSSSQIVVQSARIKDNLKGVGNKK